MASFKENLFQSAAPLVLDPPLFRPSLEQVRLRMKKSGDKIKQRLSAARATPENCRQLSHIIGIERWGQHRLQVAFGEPPLMDEYDDYRPAPDHTWNELLADFTTTRAATLENIRKLEAANPPATLRIHHHEFGDLSIRGWLRYLDMHANRETRKLS
jgi:hypothetical protein